MDVDNYHGLFVYHFGERGAPVQPYLGIGAGATHYGTIGFTGFDGSPREIGGSTKFSGALSGGVKVFPNGRAGLRLGARWTPTYIKTDATGLFCDPYFGCFVVSDAQYSNQFEFSGGLVFRF